MHGLINCSVQNYVRDTFGHDIWLRAADMADLGFSDFEAMLSYDDELTFRIVKTMSEVTGRTVPDLLEDLGTYLVSTPKLEGVRRLLRFGGVDFEEFLQSLDDLADRAKLAVSDLVLPSMVLDERADGRFYLICDGTAPGFGHVMTGVLRVIADDYGALVLLTHETISEGREAVSITLIDSDFAQGRRFDLGAHPG